MGGDIAQTRWTETPCYTWHIGHVSQGGQGALDRSLAGPDDDGDAAETTSDQMGQLLPAHYLSRIRALASKDLTRQQQFEHAYWMVLGRGPAPAELARAEAVYQAAGDDPVAALERLVWTLLNVTP